MVSENIFKDLLYISIFICKNLTPPLTELWPHPTPEGRGGGLDIYNFESTLPEVASTKISAFLAY